MSHGDARPRLQGWKAIAAFLRRDERTVKRWEGQRGLPVRRIPGGGRAAVWADPEELTAWLTGGGAWADEPAAADPPRRDRRLILAGAALAVVTVGSGTGLFLARRPRAASDRLAYADDPPAQALYLRAVLAWDSRTPAGLTAAVRDLEDLIRRRPDRPEGYVKLADCYLLLREFGVMSEAEAYRRAEAAADQAVRLDARNDGALRALAFIRFWWRADPRALELFDRAVRLRPDAAQTRMWYANALSARGRHAEALAQLREARALEPSNIVTCSAEARARGVAGDLDGARRELRRLLGLHPQSLAVLRDLAAIELRARNFDGFVEVASAEAALRGDATRGEVIGRARAAYRTAGPRALYAELAEAEIEGRRSGRGNAVMAAYYWSLAGRTDAARQWLAEARRERDPTLVMLPSLAELAAIASQGNGRLA